MISKGNFGRNFGGLLKYIAEDVDRKRGFQSDTASGASRSRGLMDYMTHSGHKVGAMYYINLAANTPEAAAREMAFVARLSRRVEKPVFQLIISLHPDESKNAGSKGIVRLAEAAARVLAKLGLSAHQAAYAVHLEKKHLHCHVAVNRVAPDGNVWPMWRSAERIRSACRQVELEMGFTPHREFEAQATRDQAATRSELGPAAWTPKEIRRYEKSGVFPAKPAVARKAERLAEREQTGAEFRPFVSGSIKNAISWDDAISRLKAKGFALELFCKTSRRGLQVVRDDGKRVAASAIESEFSLLKLERRWGRFDKDLLEQAAMSTKPHEQFAPRTALASGRLELPELVREPHRRLSEAYRRGITPILDERNRQISDVGTSEKVEIAAIRAHAQEQFCTLGEYRISRAGRAFTKSRIVQDCRKAIQACREKYRAKRQEIAAWYPVQLWIDFVIKRAFDMVQDAMTVLSWLRRHLDRRSVENVLEPSNRVRTPPEHFEHMGFKASVTDNGVIEYIDEFNISAFADRGNDIFVYTNEEGRPEWHHMDAALQHGVAKWGGCSSRGNIVFCDYALSVANKERRFLLQRFPVLMREVAAQPPKAVDKDTPGKPVVPIRRASDRYRRR